MGRMRKTRKAYVLYQRTKYEDTRPEIIFDGIFGNRVFKPLPFQIMDLEARKIYKVKPDRGFGGTNVLVEIDGPYHNTEIQQKKTKWRDNMIASYGHRIIHIDYQLLMDSKYHSYVVKGCEEFLASDKPIDRLVA